MAFVQSNMQTQDDLAALFSRNLTFNPQAAPPPAPIHHEEPQPEPAKPIIYSSQHYTHSAHVLRPQPAQQQEPPRPSSEPPQTEGPSVETVLQYHGVDPSALTPSQIQLFRIADTPQQERLVALWTICPPGKGADIPALAWSSTTVEQEEQLARMRYERLTQQQQVMSLDGTHVQAGDGRWVQNTEPDMEPYMASGYEELMRREREREAMASQPRSTYGQDYTHATDPVYMGPDFARQQQMMEMATQYGAFQAFRSQEADGMDVM
ncbi:hypothetical protein FZEAL_891 [Fusarium zealandicum]|uniref:Uncharacterized protein n=1 Tax=Fusarium zealandicum TaxID=1053134 RepID=A0A8H4UUI3_9HYPO|nr:hypothetical protein FZEAL_891 [Fusarium zealandicum]